MHKLWTDKVQGGNGKELYGDDYADVWAINRLHYKAASPEPCDHVSNISYSYVKLVEIEWLARVEGGRGGGGIHV